MPAPATTDIQRDVSSGFAAPQAARHRERLDTGIASDTGAVRPTNEDAAGVAEAPRLCVLADGMGGHNAGEVAARLAVETVLDYMNRWVRAEDAGAGSQMAAQGPDAWPFGYDVRLSAAGNRIRTAVCLADTRIHEMSASRSGYAGMGTTVVAAVVHEGLMSVAHAGDSRLYLYADGGLRQLTQDDTWLAAMGDETDASMLDYHPMRHALTNVLGTSKRADVHVSERPLSGGELLLLTSDGVHGVLDPSSLRRALESGRELSAMAEGLVAAAIRCGSRDNCTAIVARYSRDAVGNQGKTTPVA